MPTADAAAFSRSRACIRRRARSFAPVVLVAIAVFSLASDSWAAELKRIRYRHLDAEVESLCEVELKNDGRALLHLFSDRLGDVYTLHINQSDVIEIAAVPVDQVAAEAARREVVSQAARVREEELRERYRLERARKRSEDALRREKSGASAKKGAPLDSPSGRSKGTIGKPTRPSPEDLLLSMDAQFDPVQVKLARAIQAHRELSDRIADLLRAHGAKASPALRRAHADAGALLETLHQLESSLAARGRERTKLATDSENGTLMRNEFGERADHWLRLVSQTAEAVERASAAHSQLSVHFAQLAKDLPAIESAASPASSASVGARPAPPPRTAERVEVAVVPPPRVEPAVVREAPPPPPVQQQPMAPVAERAPDVREVEIIGGEQDARVAGGSGIASNGVLHFVLGMLVAGFVAVAALYLQKSHQRRSR
ncbi:MAG: hypothetical protein ACKVX7_13540 [Planctomycetota bacterium]